MKKLKLFMAVFALLLGWSNASAYTTSDLVSAGWTLETSLSDLSSKVFVILDNGGELMVGLDGNIIKYQTSANPATNLNKVWILEQRNSSYALRNVSSSKLLLQTEYNAGYNIDINDQPNVCEWTDWKFVYNDSKWTIENGKYPYEDDAACDKEPYKGYWGPWTPGQFVNDQRLAGNKSETNRGTFKIYSISKSDFVSLILAANTPTKASPVDLSVASTGLTNTTSGWVRDFEGFTNNFQAQRSNGKDTETYSNWGFLEAWNNGVTFTGTLTAAINTLPAGKYKISAHAFKNTTDAVSFKAGDNNVSTPLTNNNDKYQEVVADNAYLGKGNSMSVGFDITGATWIGLTDIRILYYGPSIEAKAIELPVSGDIEKDKWYYYDAPAENEKYTVTATTLNDIVYTSDGTILIEDEASVTDKFTATDNHLYNIRYYFKSSSDNNVVFGVAEDTYEVGGASSSIAEGNYAQSVATVTLTYSPTTTDETASISLGSGTVKLLSSADAELATASLSIAGNVVTATFTYDLTPNTSYKLSVGAGVARYYVDSEEKATSTASLINFNTPAVFDGTYYLYDATNKQFLGRGANYGCRAVADKYGIPMTVATNASNITTFKFLDNDLYLFDANEGNIYTDNSTYPNFAVVSTTGGYYVVNKNTTGTSTYGYKLYIDGSSNVVASNENSTVWTFKTSSQRDAIVNAYPTDNINTVITAASISTTAAEFKSYLSNNYTEVDKTSKIGTARFTGAVGDWTWSQVRGQDNQPAYGTGFAELWVATGTYSQTVDKANLPAGIYKVTVDGYERRATNDKSNTLGTAGYNLVSSYLAANDEQVRLTDWYNTSKPGDTGGAVTAFNNGEATNELYIYLDGNTDLTLKLAKPNYVWDCWTIFNNFTLTYYDNVKKATIGSYGYATFSTTAPVNVDVEGLEAYIATSSNGSSVTMQKVTGDVAAGIGLVLKGEAGTYTLPVVASGEWYNTETTPKNYLFAIKSDYNLGTTATGTNYVLSVQSETVVWAPIGATPAPVKAGQAALWIPNGGTSSARALRMTFGGITDVENIEAAPAATVKKNGAYLENGKIAIYKNGMKFSATGAKLK